MVEVILSQTIRELRGALPMTASGTVVMSPRSAGDFLAALDILADQARKLEAEVDQLRWRLGAARDGVRNMALAARASASDAVDEAVQRLVDRRARIERRDADLTAQIEAARGRIDAVREGLRRGTIAVFPVAPRPAPTSDPVGVDVLDGDRPRDPLGRDSAEDGA